jgi:RHH-type proline utilization regulon transcriptional repressor/proline dehydrogenase/delta 1-pyrroline-5-carboxylate dehydrogenase
VFGRTIDEALKRAAPEQARGWSHSFDMLGEGRQDPRRRRSLCQGLWRCPGHDCGGGEGAVSVKAQAFRSSFRRFIRVTNGSHAEEAKAAILPVLQKLALKAAAADVHFTIDAEEADRLELSMDLSRR